MKCRVEKEVSGVFFQKKNSAKNEIEALFHEIQINLENNYKDLAISARKKAETQLADYQIQGKLNDRDYRKLKSRLDDYTTRMEGYHH